MLEIDAFRPVAAGVGISGRKWALACGVKLDWWWGYSSLVNVPARGGTRLFAKW